MTAERPRLPRPSCSDLPITETPLNLHGNLEAAFCAIRDHRPLDLSIPAWRANQGDDHAAWSATVRSHVLDHLHYDAGPLDLRAQTLSREQRDGYILERVRFHTAPWFRLDGALLLPDAGPRPAPALVCLHDWGGPMLWGRDRIVPTDRDHPLLAAHRAEAYGGRWLAETFARRGYAVLVVDGFHFGDRCPKGLGGIPADLDPYALDEGDARAMGERAATLVYRSVKQLMWAGSTWTGLALNDDRRCIDYLRSRPEIDGERIGCTGLSGGAWRTNLLAALDPRIRAAVSVGWMTTGDHQQGYNVNGAIGSFCLLPGVWDRIDLPDIPPLNPDCATLVVVGRRDNLFPQNGVREAARRIAEGFAWAGQGDRFAFHDPDAPHCYDAAIQETACAWFDRWL